MVSPIPIIAKKAFEYSDTPSIFTDTNGFIIWCNPAFESLTEYRLDDIKGKSPGELLQGTESDKEKIKVMKNAVQNIQGFEVEIINYTKSGKKFLTQIVCEPVFDDHNKHIGFFSVQPLVTRKNKIEQIKLSETKLLLEAIFNNAEVALIIADDHMIVRNANPKACNLLGYTSNELEGMSILEYSRNIIKSESLWDDLLNKESQYGEIELIHKSGKIIYCEYKAVANVLPGKHLSMITDITDKKRHERDLLAKNNELAQANESMKTLFSIIGHDLRSPLASLQNALELLDVPDVNPNEYKFLFEGIAAKLDSNKSMLNNLLSWANQQQRGFNVNLVDVELSYLIKDLKKIHSHRAEQKKIDLIITKEAHIKTLKTDIEALRLILRNLISNAIKFCGPSDVVRLEITEIEDFICFEVSDTGKGISQDNIERIFSTGYSTNGSDDEKGTGLGLTLCNEFLGLLDSKLNVISQLGQGSTFYFNLPKNDVKNVQNEFKG